MAALCAPAKMQPPAIVGQALDATGTRRRLFGIDSRQIVSHAFHLSLVCASGLAKTILSRDFLDRVEKRPFEESGMIERLHTLAAGTAADEGEISGKWTTDLSSPTDTAVAKDGTIYIALDAKQNLYVMYDVSSGSAVDEYKPRAKTGTNLDLVFGSGGGIQRALFVGEYQEANQVDRFAYPSTKFRYVIANGFENPSGVATAPYES
jgi:hypothetical protein